MSTNENRQRLVSITPSLKTATGKGYWRSLEELADTPAFQELLHKEFPAQASEFTDPVGRRTFLKLMGASIALAGLTGCTRQPTELIAPYVRQPEEIVPGKPLFYATATVVDGIATGVLVESHMGRPTKIEGNPDHPASLGAADLFSQAAILSLYDPDRAQTLTHLGDIQPWSALLGAIRPALDAQRGLGGAGLRILTPTVTSPTLANQLRQILAALPSAKWHQFDPAGARGAGEGARLAFGQPVNAVYRFDRADVIFAIDSDFLNCGPASLRYAKDFASRRRPEAAAVMNRLYAVESSPTNTGARADHRLPIRPSEVEAFARAVAAGLGVQGAALPGTDIQSRHGRWIEALVRDLQRHRGASLVIPGDYQSPVVHALAHAMNQALGNIGNTVVFTDPVAANPNGGINSLRELVQDLEAGQVDLLVILGGNPVYSAPVDMNFGERLMKARLRVYLGMYRDETAELCQWNVPEAHFLESWSDARAYDGTVSIIQPLIAPLYNGRTAHELLAAFTDRPEQTSYEIVRDYWRTQMGAVARGASIGAASGAAAAAANSAAPGSGQTTTAQPASGQAQVSQPSASQSTGSASPAPPTPNAGSSPAATQAGQAGSAAGGFEMFWRKALHDGLIANTALQPRTVSVSAGFLAQPQPAQPTASDLDIVFRPDPTVHDGRFANNGWLQELPKPLTQITWDNVALISPATASRLGIAVSLGDQGGEMWADQVEVEFRGRKVLAPAWVLPGHPDDTVTVHLGYGRTRSGRVGQGLGFNANLIRTSDALWFGTGARISKTGERVMVAVTQMAHLISTEDLKDRNLVVSHTLEQYRAGAAAHGESGKGAHESDALERGEPGRTEHQQQEHAPGALGKEEHGKVEHKETSLYPEYDYSEGNRWGMAIDLSVCTGCKACVVACQSENNIPVVGKEQVAMGREMHWLRVDSYYKGEEANPETYFQPVPCMHCEKAPCEVVCPVAATVHSAEGLNDMVYNRCVGTRYCSNNCPYKVRRFNFFLYQDWNTPSLKMMRNPDVTIRSRGVMEKCTYCVQRISKARIEAQKEDRPIRDGEVVTACQATCPTDAIVFGNMNDPESRVAKLKADDRNYGLLAELNTQPRTTYLAAIRNPNPELENA